MSTKYASYAQVQSMINAVVGTVKSDYATKEEVAGNGSYTIKQQATAETGFAATYQLFNVVGEGQSATETAVGAKINIPKDFLVKSATLETCSTADVPVAGYVPGDKYIDFVVNTVDASETATHIYLKVTDLIDVYTAGNGLTLSNGEFAIQLGTNTNGLSVGATGLQLDTVVASTAGAGGSNGAMTAAQAEKLAGLDNYTAGDGIAFDNREINLDITAANGLNIASNKLAMSTVSASTSGEGGANGAMLATDKEKLDGIAFATDSEVNEYISGLWSTT